MRINARPGCILIVTVTKVEAQAVLDVFSPDKSWKRQVTEQRVYYNLGMHGSIQVFMVQSEMGSVTPGGSLYTIIDSLEDLKPQAIIMCGIAFGLRPEKQALGDILIARQLGSYEPQKVDAQEGVQHRGDLVTASERLLSYFRSGDLDWHGSARHFGLVLSGEKLINQLKFRDSLLMAYPEAIGGEMEGAGLYIAARASKVDWILVKGICDWADGTKNDTAQPIAASNAALFVRHVIECGEWGEIAQRAATGIQSTTAADLSGIDFTEVSPGLPEDSPIHQMLEMMAADIIRIRDARQDILSRLGELEANPDGIIHQDFRQKLLQILRDPSRRAHERAEAGSVLAILGDPRFLSNAWFLPSEELLGFVEIPAGKFLMGSEVVPKEMLILRECPQHSVELPTYYIGRYPVTQDQYQAYLSEIHPGNAPDLQYSGTGNHPAVQVTWYDAMAYGHWLTDQLLRWSDTPGVIANLLKNPDHEYRWTITLPSEAEWEKAARGMHDARVFPWGMGDNPGLANFGLTGLHTTSAVGCFGHSTSPYGIHDLSGNVWELTRSNWGPNLIKPQYIYPYVAEDGREDSGAPETICRVQRGGAYNSQLEDIRCSCRRADKPNTRYNHVGFRLVLTRLKY